MNQLTDQLRDLKASDSDVALLLDVYGEIGRIYNESLKAMGVVVAPSFGVANSAEVTLSFTNQSTSKY